jgi:hypothetical protein
MILICQTDLATCGVLRSMRMGSFSTMRTHATRALRIAASLTSSLHAVSMATRVALAETPAPAPRVGRMVRRAGTRAAAPH